MIAPDVADTIGGGAVHRVVPPARTQDVAFVDDQVRVVVPLYATGFVLAFSVTSGNGGALTETSTVLTTEPPAPFVQVIVNGLFPSVVMGPDESEPAVVVPGAERHGAVPSERVQDVAFVADHVSVVAEP